MKTEEEKDKQLIRWLEGELSGEELAAFEASEEFEDYQQIIDGTNALSYPTMNESEVFEKIQNKISNPLRKKSSPSPKVITLRRWFLAAAAIAVLALAVTTLLPSKINVSSDVGQYVTHTLPDGSEIDLNGKSRIAYNDNFQKERILSLNGEAFFKVKKGESFIVQTEEGTVEVLGTSFNVFVRDNFFIVSCKTGKVQVKAHDKSYILEKGDRVSIEDGQSTGKEAADIEEIGSWVDGVSYFSDARLEEVILSLTSIYDVDITLPEEHRTRRFRGSFVHNDIKKALKMVFSPMEIPYSLDDQGRVTFND